MPDQFEKNARTVTLLTLVSRLTGLARDAALSRVFGVTALMDAFWFAFMVPNLFRRLFGEGALSASFLPVFTQLDRDNPAVARQLATLVVSLLVLVLGGIVLVAEGVLWAIAARVEAPSDALRLTMIMLPYAPLVCTVAILGAILQVRGRFAPTAGAPIILNLFIVAATTGYGVIAGRGEDGGSSHVTFIAAAILAAGAVQVAWSLIALRKTGWWAGSLSRCREAAPGFRRVLAQAWPMFLGLGVLQINVFIDDLVASYPTTVGPTIFGVPFPLEQGALTSINAAQRLYEFPLGVFGIAIATAIFPALARRQDQAEAFASVLRRGLRLVVFIGLPASAGLMIVRRPLTAVVFEGAAFTADDTTRVAFVLLGYAPAIWAYSMTHTLTRAYYARGDAMTPVRVAVAMVVLNFALNISLIWTPLRESSLAWSTAVCAIAQTVILLRLLCRSIPGLIDRSVVSSWLKSALLTAVMTGCLAAAAAYMPELAEWRGHIVALALLSAGGLLIFATGAWLLRMPETRWAFGATAHDMN